jgi:hypothetical protein
MGAYRWLVAFVSMSLLMCSQALAGAPAIEETCRGANGGRVQTQVDLRQRYFALAGPVLTGPLAGNAYVIYINPERTYLGRSTQQWLYLRQCAHINERHPVLKGEQALNIRDEEAADCWAVRELLKTSGSSSRILYSIESDMDRLLSDVNRWREVLPGPQRRVLLSSCLSK